MGESSEAINAKAEMRFGKVDDMSGRVAAAMDAAGSYLFSRQHEEGYWCGELEADTTLEAEYIMMHTLLGTGDPKKMYKACRWMLDHQNDDGGWPVYAGGPSEISASVLTYFALKLCGYSADDPRLVEARECITRLGGPTKCNTYTKIYLCFFGQYEWWAVPAVPPEIVLFPNWFWFNIYEISSWSRGIFIPLSIVYSRKAFKKIAPEQGVQELFPGGDMHNINLHLSWDRKVVSWRNFFLLLNQLTHFFERVHIRPLRSIAMKKAEKWMLERFEMSDGLGAIYPAMMNSIIALRCLGYSLDDPQFIRAMDEFEELGIEEEDTFRMQPCKSPVWDTVYAMFALGEAGVSRRDPRMIAAADWVLKKQVTHKGDWAVKVNNVSPAGWYFEFNNEFYPDVDDTGMVNLALTHVEHPNERYQHDSVNRAIDWIFAMQCKNGGWAAFDKDNTRVVFQYIPFADHNAMLDPPTVDITGRMLEMLAAYGYTDDHPNVQRAIEFIKKEQEPDGSWFGRWGCNYIYGTMLCLRGLEAIGIDHHEPYVQQAAEWLRSIQNPDGGWGETMGSYDDPDSRGQGPSTASQTAWAVMGLLAAGDTRSDSVERGIAYLISAQRKNGSWKDDYYTGTGFPKVFYLKYHMYAEYFPLIALAAYSKAMGFKALQGSKAVKRSAATEA
ncbi:MAG TPA: squalene--hopene cyclase [Terriglobales bacterium]|nr:squalene--hopene cyclase [Terriglobales bacterium]